MFDVTALPAFASFQAAGLRLGAAGHGLPELDALRSIPVLPETLPELAALGIAIEGPTGERNRILLPATPGRRELRGRFHGARNCTVILGPGGPLHGSFDMAGQAALLIIAGIGKAPAPSTLRVHVAGRRTAAHFGLGFTSIGSEWLVEGDRRCLAVGDDGMASWGIFARNFDSHAIIDLESRAMVNGPTDLVIGPHVWIGQDAMIARGVRIGRGSIIGARSLVTRDIPDFVTAAGTPARVLRQGVTWTRQPAPKPDDVAAVVERLG